MNNEQNFENLAPDEKNALQTMKKFLGLEHFAWKFGAIVTLISAIIMGFSSFIMIIVGIATTVASQNQYNGDGVAPAISFIIMGVMYFMIVVLGFIPEAVVCFMMIKKVEYYQSTLDTDISIARTRCTSVGMIVFCVLFNTLAAVFYIINFALKKKNAAVFDRLEAAQKGN